MRWTKDDLQFLEYHFDVLVAYAHPADWPRIAIIRKKVEQLILAKWQKKKRKLK